MRGQVKYFNPDRGFGFLVGEDGCDYFVHIREVNQTLPEVDALVVGERFSFDTELDSRRGKTHATNLARR